MFHANLLTYRSLFLILPSIYSFATELYENRCRVYITEFIVIIHYLHTSSDFIQIQRFIYRFRMYSMHLSVLKPIRSNNFKIKTLENTFRMYKNN